MIEPRTKPSILVAGIGNIFFGDDAFGVAVAQELAQRPLPGHVRVVDFGIRGLDLAYALIDGYDLVILVDACRRGGEPGTLYLLEPEEAAPGLSPVPPPEIQTHGLVPAQALEWARALGGRLGAVRLVGCEPAAWAGPEAGEIGLSAPVKNAVAESLGLIESLIEAFTLKLHA